MKPRKPKRVAVIGVPGSGKSTFATKLGKLLGLHVHHLDRHMFEGKKRLDQQQFLSVKKAMVKEDSWVIEGCSISTLEMRFQRADVMIYFQFPRLVCIWRVFKRLFKYDKALSETGCLRGVNWTLLKYIWVFDEEKGPIIRELRKKYPNVDFRIFKNSKQADKYIKRM